MKEPFTRFVFFLFFVEYTNELVQKHILIQCSVGVRLAKELVSYSKCWGRQWYLLKNVCKKEHETAQPNFSHIWWPIQAMNNPPPATAFFFIWSPTLSPATKRIVWWTEQAPVTFKLTWAVQYSIQAFPPLFVISILLVRNFRFDDSWWQGNLRCTGHGVFLLYILP